MTGDAADVKPTYARELTQAQVAAARGQHVDLLLAAGSLSDSTRRLITEAVSAMPAQTPAQQRQRVNAAVPLTLCLTPKPI